MVKCLDTYNLKQSTEWNYLAVFKLCLYQSQHQDRNNYYTLGQSSILVA